MKTALLTGFGLLAAACAAQAQSITVKPGLWASANVSTFNGHKLPTIFDVKGGLTPQQKAGLADAMARLGLPAGGSPSLSCQETSTFVLPKPQKEAECTSTVSPRDATSGSLTMSCKSDSGSASGKGSYTVEGQTSATVNIQMTGTSPQGMPINYESTSVYKWVGDDCKAAPPGVDASLLRQLQRP